MGEDRYYSNESALRTMVYMEMTVARDRYVTLATATEAISNAMRRDRFDAIMRCLHFNAAVNLVKK